MARSNYWSQMPDKSLSLQDRLVAYAYAELEDASESVARAANKLAVEAADLAVKWEALQANVEESPVPMVWESALSEQYDKAVRRFREKEAALKMALSAKRQFDRESAE